LNLALEACSHLLIGHGGHASGSRFSGLGPENLKAFRERFCEVVAKHFPDGPPPPELVLDAKASLAP
jgi:single-stranded DNA-specific DHH superfamily exonuclease